MSLEEKDKYKSVLFCTDFILLHSSLDLRKASLTKLCILFCHSILSNIILCHFRYQHILFYFLFFITSLLDLPLLLFVPSTWTKSLLIGSLFALLCTWTNHLKLFFLIFSSTIYFYLFVLTFLFQLRSFYEHVAS